MASTAIRRSSWPAASGGCATASKVFTATRERFYRPRSPHSRQSTDVDRFRQSAREPIVCLTQQGDRQPGHVQQGRGSMLHVSVMRVGQYPHIQEDVMRTLGLAMAAVVLMYAVATSAEAWPTVVCGAGPNLTQTDPAIAPTGVGGGIRRLLGDSAGHATAKFLREIPYAVGRGVPRLRLWGHDLRDNWLDGTRIGATPGHRGWTGWVHRCGGGDSEWRQSGHLRAADGSVWWTHLG